MHSPARILLASLVLFLGGACAGTGSSGASGGAGERPAEIPAAHRELWQAWTTEAPDWPARREQFLRDQALTRFFVENLTRELVQAYLGGELSRAHDGTSGRYDRARAELIVLGEHAVPTVSELMVLGDGSVALVCAELLEDIGAGAVPYVAGLLEREDAPARRRAALLLADLPRTPAVEAEVQESLAACLREDADWAVRAASARALSIRGARSLDLAPSRSALSAALADPDEAVSSAAAAGLGRLGDRKAIPALINHLERSERRADLQGVRSCLGALRQLSGASEPRYPAEWREWLKENGTGR